MAKDLSLSVVNTHAKPPTTSTARLSWATSVFYFGMLAGLLPMTLTLQRFQLGRVLGGVVMLWGLIAMLTAAVTSFRGLYVQRFFLGFAESIIPTGFMCIVSGYYTQEEQSMRQSLWFSSTGAWTVIGGALNYGFAQITGGTLKRWQYIYLFAGALTVLFGVICFAIPNSAVTAWFLSTEERRVAVERLRKGQTGVRCQKIKWSQIQEGLFDIKVWLVALMMAGAYVLLKKPTVHQLTGIVIPSTALSVDSVHWLCLHLGTARSCPSPRSHTEPGLLSYTTLDSILLQFPLGGIVFIFILLTGYLSSRIPNIRLILIILCCLPVIAGCAMIWKSTWSHHAATPVVGYTIIGFFGPVVSLIISIGMANVAGATKKSFTAAAIFIAYCVGNVGSAPSINFISIFTFCRLSDRNSSVRQPWNVTIQSFG